MEQAQRQAFEKIFPASQLCACYFHFSQAMIRKQKVTIVEISKQLFSQALKLDTTLGNNCHTLKRLRFTL